MKVLFSAIAKRKLDLLSICLTIEWGDDILFSFIETLESKIDQVSSTPQSHQAFFHENLKICVVSEQCFFVYIVNEQTISIVDLFDNRQNPTIIYKDLIEYFS
ncbi:MAG: hypothetical protein JKY48_10635 [Flavobacteriales bacterium]|nr:hypothetical protein [Flavobacteriales bacterium]